MAKRPTHAAGTQTPSGAARQAPPARRLVAATGISSFGSYATLIALPFVAVQRLGVSAFAVAMLPTAEYASMALAGLVAGRAADRGRPVRLAQVASLVGGLAVVSLAAVHALAELTYLQLVFVALVVGASRTYFDASIQALVSRVVPDFALPKVNADLEQVRVLAQLFGPPLAGLVIGIVSAYWVFTIDAVTYVMAPVILFGIKGVEPKHVSAFTELDAAGGRTSLSNRAVVADIGVRNLALITASLNLGGGVIAGLFYTYVYRDLGLSAITVSVAFAGGGVGGFVGARLSRPLLRSFDIAVALLLSAIGVAMALWIIPLAAWRSGGILIGAYEFLFAGFAVVMGLSSTLARQRMADVSVQGQIFGILRFAGVGAAPIGLLLGAVLSTWVGVFGAIVVGPALTTLGVVFAIRFLKFWRARPTFGASMRPVHGDGSA